MASHLITNLSNYSIKKTFPLININNRQSYIIKKKTLFTLSFTKKWSDREHNLIMRRKTIVKSYNYDKMNINKNLYILKNKIFILNVIVLHIR